MIRRKDALGYHREGRPGKLEIVATKPLLTQRDLALAYSPGVAEPCLEIAKDAALSYEYTTRGNMVGVISNGTAVLGLGDIGPYASKPVMEGKGVLFKKFADIDVFDIELSENDPKKLVEIIAALEPTFGGINLEDIKAPECFYVEEELKKRMAIPVFHDDQHGTAIISGAALLNACELQNKQLKDLRVVVSGAGASAIACAHFYVTMGVPIEQITLCDSTGVIHDGRKEGLNAYKLRFAHRTKARTLVEALAGADVFLGCSKGGLMTREMIQSMADRPIVFALANPDPEISYPDATAARSDVLIATGRSDYPNQVNNVLGFPFIFRGALDVRARAINEEMKLAASKALAALARQDVPESVCQAYGVKSLRFGPDYIIPKPFDPRALWWVASAVAEAAMASGVATQALDLAEYRERLQRMVNRTPEVLRKVVAKARLSPKRIVFPEGDNIRVLRACQIICDEQIAKPILLGERKEILENMRALELDLEGRVEIIDPRQSTLHPVYTQRYLELRERKGANPEWADRVMRRRNPFGIMMVHMGDADGVVSGQTMSYAETIRPALQILGMAPGVSRATGMYMVVMPKREPKFFADATVNIEPDEETLAEVAIQCADQVAELGITPRVAMLSFSNFGSARHPQAQLVARATELVRQRRPDIEIDGEMQLDIAVAFDAKMKEQFPFCRLTDEANVLVFPNLAAGNVAYKLMQSLGGAAAVGPILLGMAKPVTVLQRGCSIDTIVEMAAFTVVKAQGGFKSPISGTHNVVVPSDR